MSRMALNVARNTGWPVFACKANKAPATPHGFNDASTDPSIINRMFRHPEAALIGLPTGAVSGIDVLDVDVKHPPAVAWLAAAASRIPSTRTFRTKSGGVHLYFRHREGIGNTQSKVARGVDTRGNGGYVVFWFAAGYECLDHSPPAPWPSWLIDVLLRPIAPPPIRPTFGRYVGTGTHPAAMIARALDRVAAAAEGHRHDTLRAAARTIGGLLDGAGMTRTEAEARLLDAVVAAGGARVDRANASRTIAWALDRGAAAPLTMRGRRS